MVFWWKSGIVLVVLIQVRMAALTTDVFLDEVEDGEAEDGPDCPRDREAAESKGRECNRKCRQDADCISARKRCLCDGLCGRSCVRPDLHCEELSAPENGSVSIAGEMFGAIATYSCREGYWLSGNKDRVCQGNAKWSGKQPECKFKIGSMCISPPQVPFARHSAPLDKEDFPLDSVVQYTCFPGYNPKGFPTAKCLHYNGTAQWFGPDLRCMPRSCGPPGEIERGTVQGDTFTFTSRVTYFCTTGFELVGRASRYCQSNGQWSGQLPSCRPVQCDKPEDPLNGRAYYTSVSFNSVVTYECRFGFRLLGPHTRTCNTEKQWEGPEPTCEEIKCEDPDPFYNGYFEGRSTNLGATLHFHCYEGNKMEGFRSATCGKDGNWSNPIPRCMSPCIVPELEQGNFTGYHPGARVPHGVEIQVSCVPKFDVFNNAAPVTCENGTWSYVPTCSPVYCPFPGVLPHGRVLLVGYMGMYDYRPYVKKVTNNRQIMYECRRHWTLVEGPPGATCLDGQWSPKQLPKCVRGSHPVLTTNNNQRRRRELRFRNHFRRGGKRRRRTRERALKEACTLPDTDIMSVSIVRPARMSR